MDSGYRAQRAGGAGLRRPPARAVLAEAPAGALQQGADARRGRHSRGQGRTGNRTRARSARRSLDCLFSAGSARSARGGARATVRAACGPAEPRPIPERANKTLDCAPGGPSSTREAPAASADHTADAVQPPAPDKPVVPDNPAVPDKPSAQPSAVTPPQEIEHHPTSARQPTNKTLDFQGTPAGGWIVQLGSFASRANADRL